MSIEKQRSMIETALGIQKPDLVIKNARIINVFTKEIMPGDIAVCDGFIAGIGNYEGIHEVDAGGRFACPGLIDSHVHIESSMVTPAEFARAILPYGTTTIIADPHEIANVCGINGMHYMLNHTRNLPMNVYFMIPSCVPATPFENNGADLTPEVMEPLRYHDRILGLGEVMDYPSVLDGNENMLKKMELFSDSTIDGHSPSLTGKQLNAYRATGVATDHECSTFEEVMERLRLGMYVQIREGSGARNLEAIVRGMLERKISFHRCIFCTDDKHLEDIRKQGHISYNIKKAIRLGVDPMDAVCMATINAAQCYGLKNLGAIAPGYSADLVLLDDLRDFSIDSVIFRGRPVIQKDFIVEIPSGIADRNVLNTVRIPPMTPGQLKILLSSNLATVVKVVPGEILTKKETAEVKTDNGCFIADTDFSKLAVIERHKATGNIGLGIVSGFHIKNGAIAGTVAHDSHNLIAIGDNDEDMLTAIHELKRVNGGYTIVSGGRVIDTLELPIAGLISDREAAYVEAKLEAMLRHAYALGVNPGIDPLITLSFLALPVIPEIRVTDRGLFNVTEFRFIDV